MTADAEATDTGPNEATPDFLSAGGAMGALMQATDWSETPLGVVDAWPQSLRAALSICLGSGFPNAIYWGPELCLLYNDAWRPIAGNKHPWALGRPAVEVWPETWDTIGPLFERVVQKGEATRSRDQLLSMRRHDYTEECYFDYTFSPIRDETGRVAGVFNAVLETTQRVIGERRMRTLRELAVRTAEARNPAEACRIAANVLAEDAEDVPFTLLYLLSADGDEAQLAASAGLEHGAPASPPRVTLSDEVSADAAAWPLTQTVRDGQMVVIKDLQARFGALPGGPWPESPHTAVLLPISHAAQRQPYGVLVAGASPRRELDDAYEGFFQLVAGHVATAVGNARAGTPRLEPAAQAQLARVRREAQERLRRSEERFRQLIDVSPQFVWINRPDGALEYVNRRWLDYSGLDLESSIDNQRLAAAIHPDDRRQIFGNWQNSVETGRPFEMEARLRAADGSFRWFLIRTMPLRDEKGRIVRWFGASTDIHEQKQSAENARFLAALADAIRLSQDPDDLMSTVAQMAGEHFQAIRCFFADIDETAGYWTVHRDFRRSSNMPSLADRYPLTDAPPDMLASFRDGRIVRVSDTAQDLMTRAFHEPIYEPLGVRSLIAVPLLREGRWVFTFTLFYDDVREWSSSEITLLEAVAERAWNAVERARAEASLRESEQRLRLLNETLEQRVTKRTAALAKSERQLRRMASTITRAEQEERRRISQILHDDLQQQLYSIQMKLILAREEISDGDLETAVQSIRDAEEWIGESVHRTRQLTVDLSPPILKREGLADMIAWLVPQMEEMYGLHVDLIGEHSFHIADGDLRLLLFQIVRELLFNVVKHAGAQRATVKLRREEGRLHIEVGDKGRGFNVDEATIQGAGEAGFGLYSARERLRLFGGRMEIESAPGEGARVSLTAPLND